MAGTNGITSTPVIDPTTNRVYLLTREANGGNASDAVFVLRVLDLRTGASLGSTTVSASVPGGATFDPNPRVRTAMGTSSYTFKQAACRSRRTIRHLTTSNSPSKTSTPVQPG